MIKNVAVIGVKLNKIKGFKESNGPIHLSIRPIYSDEKIDNEYVLSVDIQILITNVQNADGLSIMTLFGTGDRKINLIPTESDNNLIVELALVAIDHARLIFFAEQEKIGLANPDGAYLPIFDRNEIAKLLRSANHEAMN